jgi:phage-related protein (TIGR01555 family)
MIREGFRLVSAEVEDDVLEDAMDYFERLTLTDDDNKLADALIWGRLYGGAALVIGVDDENLSEPLDLGVIDTIKHLTLLNRFELIPQDINGNPASGNFGMPETYLIQPRVTDTTNSKEARDFANGSIKIHYSRLIRFNGSKLARRTFISNHYWHDSILNKLQDDIRDYQAAFASVSALILDFAQAVYKVKNLADIIAAPDGLTVIQNRIAIIEQTRSILRAAIIDADGEDFERKTTSMQGMDRTLGRLTQKFVAATEYPHTVLLGESPSGLGATGNSEKKDYFETVRSEQNNTLKPRLMRIFKLIFAAKDGPTGGKVPEDFDIEFEALMHLDQAEEITARKQQAEIDKIYIEAGVVDPDEVALSRFASGVYDYETEINEDLRSTDERQAEKDAANAPDLSGMVGVPPGAMQAAKPVQRTDGYRKKRAAASRKYLGSKFK